MKPEEWIKKVNESVGKTFSLETTDGVLREGRITGLTHKSFFLNGKESLMPVEIEVNKDPNDRIPLDRLLSFNIH